MNSAIASAILVPLLVRLVGLPAIGGREALTGIFLFHVLLLYGLTLTGAAESGIVTSTTPRS